jgi:ATP synthase subunit 6|tara:strand:- start:865 stop:1647 length:783 start_codon:yes stop_codon:yes gene_type:complete
MFLNSPLEQFQILPLINLYFGGFDFSITNSICITMIGLGSFLFLVNSLLLSPNESSLAFHSHFSVVPGRWQVIVEGLYEVIANMLKDIVGARGENFFPYVFTLFTFILISNLIGLVPYSFTSTSHLIVTFFLAAMTFIGINIIGGQTHGVHFFSLFFPPGSPLGLAPLLIPIEIVSYIFRPISLSVRLFANMMAGHTLLKVIGGFAWNMMSSSGLLFIAHFVPIFVLILLMGLELGVAIVQAYVFIILTCIYLSDAISLH